MLLTPAVYGKSLIGIRFSTTSLEGKFGMSSPRTNIPVSFFLKLTIQVMKFEGSVSAMQKPFKKKKKSKNLIFKNLSQNFVIFSLIV